MIDDLKIPATLREKLEQVLIDAFDEPGLERLARRLEIELAHIAEGSRRNVVSRFVEEVGRLGQGKRLVRIARRANPTHRGLNELLGKLMPRRFNGRQVSELVRLLQEAAMPWNLVERQSSLCLPDTYEGLLSDEIQDEADRIAQRVDLLSEFAGGGAGGASSAAL